MSRLFTTEMLRKRWCMRVPWERHRFSIMVITRKLFRPRTSESNLKLLERAVQETPDEANYRYNYALELRNAGRGQEALGHYQKAIDLLKTLPDEAQVPEFTHALVQQYGSVLLEEKGYEKAAEMAADLDSAPCCIWCHGACRGLLTRRVKSMRKHLELWRIALPCVISRCFLRALSRFNRDYRPSSKERFTINWSRGKASEASALAVMDSPDNLDYLIDYAAWLHAHSKWKPCNFCTAMPITRKDPRYCSWVPDAGHPRLRVLHLDWTTEVIKFSCMIPSCSSHTSSLHWSPNGGEQSIFEFPRTQVSGTVGAPLPSCLTRESPLKGSIRLKRRKSAPTL